ncbi:MAG: peptidoglycan-binding protein [Lachnospiraceae bacterium]|nr:peptidoglycan-binding protein [Lachnospiraceae bacterium]
MNRTLRCEAPDISVHNGSVNIKQIRDAGYPMVGLRAGYGKNNVDQKYVVNAEACHNLEVSPLIYWFSYALSVEMAAKEAEYAVAQARKYWQRCPIAFDLEYDTVRYARTKGVNIDKQLATDMAIAFLQAVRAAGYIPVMYTNEDYLQNYFNLATIIAAVGQVYVWYARYGCSNLPASRVDIADIWQYTSSGSIPGVSGKADLNKVYTDLYIDTQAVETTAAQDTCNINILNFQHAANEDGYQDEKGRKLIEDGKDGTNTQYVRRQIILSAKLGFLRIERSTGEVVKWVQIRLNEILGVGLEITGEYDATTIRAVKEFQRQYNLVVDGVAGYNTLQMLFYS